MFVITVYDISDNKRRNRMHKTLKSFGDPVQESVFEAILDSTRFKRMHQRVEKIITEEDQVRYYFLCESCRAHIHVVNGKPAVQPKKRRIL